MQASTTGIGYPIALPSYPHILPKLPDKKILTETKEKTIYEIRNP